MAYFMPRMSSSSSSSKLATAVQVVVVLVLLCHAAVSAQAKLLTGTGNYFMVLQLDGQVYVVGSDEHGQLGLGFDGSDDSAAAMHSFPTRVPNVSHATDVVAGGDFACILDQAELKCSGQNDHGQLGDWTFEPHSTFLPVYVDSRATADQVPVSLAAGLRSACFIDNKRAVSCWGYNEFGGIGRGPMSLGTPTPGGDVNRPYQVILGSAGQEPDFYFVEQVALGEAHGCFLNAKGAILCTGRGNAGQLGLGTFEDADRPRAVIGLPDNTRMASVACGAEHTCAATEHGAMLCWGGSFHGALGSGTVGEMSFAPVQVVMGTSVASVAAGYYNSFAILSNGSMLTFGQNDIGQLGDGTEEDHATPVLFAGGMGGIRSVAGGYGTVCVQKQEDNTVHCVGDNSLGQRGVGVVEVDDTENSTGRHLVLTQMQGLPDIAWTKAPTQRSTSAAATAATTGRAAVVAAVIVVMFT